MTNHGGSHTTTAIAKAFEEGEREARGRDAFNYQDERTWQRGDKGYHRSFGERERYAQTFRTGYAAGYTDGYRRYCAELRLRQSAGGPVYPTHAVITATAIPVRADILGQGGYGYPGGGYGYAKLARPRERRPRRLREGARGRTRSRSRTIRGATSGIAKATTTTAAHTVRVNAMRTSTGRDSHEGYDRGYRESSYRR